MVGILKYRIRSPQLNVFNSILFLFLMRCQKALRSRNHIFFLGYRYQFPSLQTLGEDLITVLDFLHVRYAVGLGEGAGANVLARCGLAHPRRLLGLILVNCTASASSVADAFRTRFSRWKGADISQSEEDFLIYHKFGHVSFEDSIVCLYYQVLVFFQFCR